MELLLNNLTANNFYEWSITLEVWMFYAALLLLAVETVRYFVKNAMTWNLFGDGLANFITSAFYYLIYYVALGAVYVSIYYLIYENFRIVTVPTNLWTAAICVLLADFLYYWEHRFSHRTGIGWSTHLVHHSSPYFNISVAYRFGPLDGLLSIPFTIPLAVAGFNPLVIFAAYALVLLYQTPLHTKLIGKLPKPIEMIFNTPSHHRVHHGSNPQYLDKNYGGIFIIWDRIFGTFAAEQEEVNYGIRTPINSVNPLVIFFSGFWRLGKKIVKAGTFSEVLNYLVLPPDWKPKKH